MVKLLLLLVVGASAKPKWHELSSEYSFGQYVQDFAKAYEGAEYDRRKLIFEGRLTQVLTHNARADATWRQGVNDLSDWTDDEIRKYKKGLDKTRLYSVAKEQELAKMKTAPRDEISSVQKKREALPAAWDWRDVEPAVLSPIKDQASCGSCWSFAATEVMETNIAMETGTLLELAPQVFVDCAQNPKSCGGTGGCEGATAEIAFSTAMNLGLINEADRPYQGTDGVCTNLAAPVANITGFVQLPRNVYDPLLEAVATVGPVAVSVDASWDFYETGVFPFLEGGTDINHAVVCTGYGHDLITGLDYWTIRNSWGESWGEQGYIRLERQADPVCAIDYFNSDGVGCAGDPQEVTVCGTSAILYDCSYPTGGYLL